MKSILFTGLLFFALNHANSQLLWTTVLDLEQHNKSHLVSNKMMGDTLIIKSVFTNVSCGTKKLFAYDLSGNLLWQTNFKSRNEVGSHFDAIAIKDEHIYTAGFLHEDDYFLETDPIVLSKRNALGEVVFQNFYDGGEQQLWFKANDMDIGPDGEFAVSSETKEVIFANNLGEVLWHHDTDFPVINITFADEDKLIMLSNNAVYSADYDGIIQNSLSLSEEALKMLNFENKLYILQHNQMLILNTSLEVENTISLDDQIQHQDIKIFYNSLWLMSIADNEITTSKLEGNDFIVQGNYGLYVDAPDFLITEEYTIISGTSYTGQAGMYAYSNENNDNEYLWNNIELVDFDIENVEFNYLHNDPDLAISFDFDAYAVIRNNGQEAVSSLAVFSMLSGGMNCAKQFYYKKFTDELIAPGSESLISLGRINEHTPPGTSNELCFEVLAPNNSLELVTNNNYLCKTFNLTSMQDIATDKGFSLFPNPTSGSFYLDIAGASTNAKVLILNINGQLLKQLTTATSSTLIDISSFSPGVYLIKAHTENKVFIGKILKQ